MNKWSFILQNLKTMDENFIKERFETISTEILSLVKHLNSDVAQSKSEVTQPFWSKKVLTLDELIEYTGFKRATIHRLTSTNQIPFSKPNGKSLFFDREKIEAWLLCNPHKSNAEIEREAVACMLKIPAKSPKCR